MDAMSTVNIKSAIHKNSTTVTHDDLKYEHIHRGP